MLGHMLAHAACQGRQCWLTPHANREGLRHLPQQSVMRYAPSPNGVELKRTPSLLLPVAVPRRLAQNGKCEWNISFVINAFLLDAEAR